MSVCRSSCLQSVLKSLPSPRFLNLPEEGTVTPGKETGATSEGPSDHTLTSMGKKSKYKALKELVPTNLFNFVYPSPKKHGTVSLHPLPLPSPDLHEKFPVRCHNSGVCSAPPPPRLRWPWLQATPHFRQGSGRTAFWLIGNRGPGSQTTHREGTASQGDTEKPLGQAAASKSGSRRDRDPVSSPQQEHKTWALAQT